MAGEGAIILYVGFHALSLSYRGKLFEDKMKQNKAELKQAGEHQKERPGEGRPGRADWQ